MPGTLKKRLASALGGAVATAAIPFSYGVVDYRVLAGSAALGAIGGLCGVNVAGMARRYAAKRKAPPV
jgi:hypothetical protein